MLTLKVPYSAEHVTPRWLTEALRSTGVIKGTTVTSFDSEGLAVGQGFSGQIVRLRPAYDSHEEGAPLSLIAKFPATDPKVRAIINELGSYEREIRFYETVSERVELRTPRRYYSATDREAGDHVLLLEDMAPARVGDNVAGCSNEDAELAFREIAKFHAAFWEIPRRTELEWMSNFAQEADIEQGRYQRLWKPFLAKVDRVMPPALLDIGQKLSDNEARIKRQLGEPPRTIVHGDYRLDNMFFGTSEAGPSFTVIDWQGPTLGRGVADLGYFVAFCMDPEQRRATESGLLKVYHSLLLERGVGGYDFDQCLYDYRLSLLHHLERVVKAIAVLDVSSERGQMFVETVLKRFDSALTDHDAMELMPG